MDRINSLDMELLSTFPQSPPRPRSRARMSLQSSAPAPQSSDYGSVPTRNPTNNTDADSLYAEPGPPLPPTAQLARNPHASRPKATRQQSELQIVLDRLSKVYAPGELITGYIIGWSNEEEQVQIILSGHTRSTIQASNVACTNYTPLLLKVERQFLDLQGPMPRFELSVPYLCDMPPRDLNDFTQVCEPGKKYWTANWPAQDPFENDSGHPLPP